MLYLYITIPSRQDREKYESLLELNLETLNVIYSVMSWWNRKVFVLTEKLFSCSFNKWLNIKGNIFWGNPVLG